MNISIDHHFIPKFFIKEFADEKGRVFLYNKKERKFEENVKKGTNNAYLKETFKPEEVFFIKNMNTISFSGQDDDIIEKYLNKYFDNSYSKSFQNILGNFEKFIEDENYVFEMSKIGNEHIYNEEFLKKHYRKKLDVSYFIAELFCRNPHNFSLIKSFLQSQSKKSLINDFPDLIKVDIILRSYFEIFDIRNINSDWRVLWSKKENNVGILSDMPIIYRDFSKLQNFSELAIPISRDKVIIYTKNLRIKEEEKRGGCMLYEKLATFAMAEKFVIGCNKLWIEKFANTYYQFVDKYGEEQAKNYHINRFFDCFENEN